MSNSFALETEHGQISIRTRFEKFVAFFRHIQVWQGRGSYNKERLSKDNNNGNDDAKGDDLIG